MATKIGLRSLEKYIDDSLPRRLKLDLRALRMVKEADLEACAYHHLRRYLKKDKSWVVYLRKHSVHTGHYIDLLLFRNGLPRVAIELKWNRKQISLKDRRSLDRALKLLRVNRTYFITTLIGTKPYDSIHKARIEKNRMFEIVIPLSLADGALRIWKERRRKFMSRMATGRAKRKHRAA